MSLDWGELLPHIAHDTRALVRKGLANAQLLERVLAPEQGTDAHDHLRAVIESQMDLNRLFVRLVALADADRPRRSSSKETVDLETAVLGAKLEFRSAIPQAGAEIVIHELPPFQVPQKIQIVLRELIENSLRYRDPLRALRVVIRAEADRETMRVLVSDNGTGIPPAYSDKLFQPLQRLDAERSGPGLGLAISHAIIASSGGKIYFEPCAEGASFVFELPIQA